MSTTFKVGDKVKVVNPGGYLHRGDIHTISMVSEWYVYSDTFTGGYYHSRFALVDEVHTKIGAKELQVKIDKAKSLIGKKVVFKTCRGVATSWELFFNKEENTSMGVNERIEKDGYCVAVRYASTLLSPVDDMEEDVSKVFVLNKDYNAVVTKESIKVGCQTIDPKVILEMAEYIKTL